jgi:hypothetical protein
VNRPDGVPSDPGADPDDADDDDQADDLDATGPIPLRFAIPLHRAPVVQRLASVAAIVEAYRDYFPASRVRHEARELAERRHAARDHGEATQLFPGRQ